MQARFCFRCGREFYQLELFCPNCGSGRRSINVNNPSDHKDAEELIKYYFRNGTQYKMIVLLLRDYCNVHISIRTLKRWLKELGLKRRGNPPPDMAVRRIIQSEIESTSGIKGYRNIWHKLKINGISVNRDDVMNIVKEINPEQSKDRRARKLERRIYTSPGPNAVCNQRIENLWSHYKRTYTTWIINFFKDLIHTNTLRLGDHFQMECAWFVFQTCYSLN